MRRLLLLSLVLPFVFSQVLGQTRDFTGTVQDSKGEPLVGATVSVVGTRTSATTGATGEFTLRTTGTPRQLEVTYVGYTTQRIAIGNKTSFEVKLAAADPSLSEVIVVAYGTVKKEALTGSVGTIKTEQIAKRPINNITNAVEGAVPGVVTTSANGQPGSGNTIRVRGFGSVNASQDPLFVVDGVPYPAGTSNINPDDVESITILKDAASTALYGSRAANGVVVITTKKGRKGRNNVSIRALQGIATRGLPEYERLEAFQYYPTMWEAYRNSLVYPISARAISLDSASRVASGLTTRNGIKDLLAYNPFNVAANTIVSTDGKINPNAQLIYGDDLDWTKDLIRRGSRKDYSVNFNGGADKSDYFVSAGYVKENGYTLKTDFERYSVRANVNVQPKTWLKTGFNISGNYSTSSLAADGGSTNFVNPFFYSRNVGPIYPVYAHNMTTGEYLLDVFGNRIYDLGNFGTTPLGIANGIPNKTSGGFAGRHALAETTLNEDMYRRTVASGRNYVDLLFLKNFKFTNNVAIDFQTQSNGSYQNTLVGDGAPSGRSSRSSTTNTTLTLNQLLSYAKTFNDHRFDVLAGHESYSNRLSSVSIGKQGQISTGNSELANFSIINSATSSVDRTTIESFFSRINYDYKGKYYVSGSIRRDGNSQFSRQSRWGTFWSVGGGWNIHKESFMNDFDWIDNLKLRSSYGGVGNATGIGTYAYQGLYNYNTNAGIPGFTQSQTAILNNSLTWESNTQFDVGVDFSLFKNRISGSFEYYRRNTTDLLFQVPQPLSSGLLEYNQNIADMYNKGIELNLNGNIIQHKNFVWNMNLNLSTAKNVITKMPPSSPEIIDGTKKLSAGHSIYDYWLRTFYGVDPADGAALYVPANTATTANRRIVTNKDGGSDTVTTIIANAKFDYHGSSIPDLYGSVTESVTYKRFTLSALLTFQLGGKIYDGLYQSLMSGTSYGAAVHKDILNSWHAVGDVTNTPRLDIARATDFNGSSTRWLVDASFLNIRNINLSYSLPTSLASRLTINNATVFASVENLAFFNKRKGMNNQQSFAGTTSNVYPPARIITGGITLNF